MIAENFNQKVVDLSGTKALVKEVDYEKVRSGLEAAYEELNNCGFTIKTATRVSNKLVEGTIEFGLPYSRSRRLATDLAIGPQYPGYNDPASDFINKVLQYNLKPLIDQFGDFILFDPNGTKHANGAKGDIYILLPPPNESES